MKSQRRQHKAFSAAKQKNIFVILTVCFACSCATHTSVEKPSKAEKSDMSGATAFEASLIEESCSIRKIQGPAAYYECIEQQLADLEKTPKKPDMSAATIEETILIEESCSIRKIQGPAAYYECIEEHLSQLGL